VYRLEEQVGGIGLFVAEGIALVMDTGGCYTILACRGMGSRLAQLAGLYNQWRVNKLTMKYVPFNYIGQFTENTNATVYGSYPFAADVAKVTSRMAIGFTLDPTVGASTFTEVIQMGGKEFNPARPCFWNMAGNHRWLYIDPRVSDTVSDARFVSPGQINAVSYANGPASAGACRSFGSIEMHWDISFRYPLDADSDDALARAACGVQAMNKLKALAHVDDVSCDADDEKSDSGILISKEEHKTKC
jgi:hypothetical protein